MRRAGTYVGEGWSLGGPGDDRVGLVLQVRHSCVRAGSGWASDSPVLAHAGCCAFQRVRRTAGRPCGAPESRWNARPCSRLPRVMAGAGAATATCVCHRRSRDPQPWLVAPGRPLHKLQVPRRAWLGPARRSRRNGARARRRAAQRGSARSCRQRRSGPRRAPSRRRREHSSPQPVSCPCARRCGAHRRAGCRRRGARQGRTRGCHACGGAGCARVGCWVSRGQSESRGASRVV